MFDAEQQEITENDKTATKVTVQYAEHKSKQLFLYYKDSLTHQLNAFLSYYAKKSKLDMILQNIGLERQ